MGRTPMELPEAFALAASGGTMAQIAKALGVSYSTVLYWAQRNGIELAKYKHSLSPLNERVIALAKDGIYPAEIARQTGMSHPGVRSLLIRHNVVPGKCGNKPAHSERAEKMAHMYRQGVTLEKIGQQFDLTRERVRQILKRLGLTGKHGGQSASAAVKRLTAEPAAKAKRDARCFAKWGVDYASMKAGRADGTLDAFCSQKNCAKGRGIAWGLSFAQWLAVWRQSGKLELRGRGKGRYVMSRIKDDGGYQMGNVHIQLSTVNNSEGIKKCRTNKALHTGVWRIYPGSDRPWIAKVARTLVGRYATEDEAAAGRDAYLKANPQARRVVKGRGYTILRNRRGEIASYQVQIGRRYIGTFKTPELALAARAAAQQTAQAA